jgi:serine phosphatase RsbU (regulator of sigma subunit)
LKRIASLLLIKLLGFFIVTLLPFVSWCTNTNQVDPYNPTEIRYKLTLALSNSAKDPSKSLMIINEAVLQAEQFKDKPTIHHGYVTKGKYHLINHQLDEALIAFNIAYINALSLGLDHQIHEALLLLSEVHLIKELRNESLEFLHKGFNMSQLLKDSASIAWYLVNIPEVEQESGNIGSAMEFALKGKSFFDKTKDKANLGRTYLNLCRIHSKLGNIPSSRINIDNATEIFRRIPDSVMLAKAYAESANLLLIENKLDEAKSKCIESLNILEKRDKREFLRSTSLLGEIYTTLNNYTEGKKILQQVIDEQNDLGDITGQAYSHLRLANLYRANKKNNLAIESYNKCLKLAQNVGLTDLVRQAYKGLSQIKGINNNLESAYIDLNHYTRITDSLFNVQKISEATKLEENALRQQHFIELKSKEDELSRQEDLISQQRQKQVLLYIVIALFAAVIVFSYREYSQKKRANELLSQQKNEIEKQKQIADQKTRNFTDSLNYAQRIQQAILRTSLKIQDLFAEAFIIVFPKDIVSGDFYWVKEKNNRILFALADCTGHGVPGALMSIIGTYGLNRMVNEMNVTNPSEMLMLINSLFEDTLKQKEGVEVFDGMDIALCSFNPKTMELKYSGANIPLYICRSNILPQPSNAITTRSKSHTLYNVKAAKQPIGSFFECNAFVNHSITLMEGDIIYLFSDGFSDQFGGPEGRKFKSQQLYKLLVSLASIPLNEQKSILEKTFIDWKGNLNQVDDMSFMGIRI